MTDAAKPDKARTVGINHLRWKSETSMRGPDSRVPP